ncbi:NADase-type glycan-binding domain-containing protein [Streptomyces fuscichromogenes]|uniref:NADase-type glycan-binding domain-containing protein n=1 Tax=Streptomyces fuscichromogenes TaxID=1324013 RepID=UPI00381DE61B
MTTNRNCTECGTVAEPGQSFCDACGAVLSWTGNSEEPRQQPAATTPPPGSGTAPGWDAFTRRDGATGLPHRPPQAAATTTPLQTPGDLQTPATTAPLQTHGAPQAPATTAPLQTPGDLQTPATAAPLQGRGELRGQPPLTATSPTAETTPIPTPQPAPEPEPIATPTPTPAAPPTPTSDHDRARLLLIPVSDPEPAAAPPTVAPVLPGRPTPQRPASVRAPGEDLGAHGGTPCPWCATPNRPDRHFCTRCAMPMAGHPGTDATARRPWWRRLFDFRNRQTPWAGDRPRLRRTFDRVLTWIVAAVVLTGITVLAVNTPKAISATRDHFAKRAQVSPDSYRASRSYAGHKPDLLFDKLNNTWWGPGIVGGGEGEWVEAHFDEPTRLLNVVVTSGESTHNDQLKNSALPHRMKATIKTADGKTETREVILDQTAGGQVRALRAADVVSVRFTIESSYRAPGRTQVAIAEIEFFGPSSANS